MVVTLALLCAPLIGPRPVAALEPRQRLARIATDPAPTLALAQYPGLLHAALELLDAHEPRAAAEAFERAGSCAPHTPVWRVHAGVARAMAAERDAALAHFVGALEVGYPLDDLVAIATSIDVERSPGAPAGERLAEIVHAAGASAQVPDEAARGSWHVVAGVGHDVVPFSAEARDHGDLLELAYEGRARRVFDTVGEWHDDGAPLARHELLDPASLAVVARIAPPRPAGLGVQLGPDGARTPLPDPRPIWVDAQGAYLEQRRFRELVNLRDAPDLALLPRGLRTGVWLAAQQRVVGVACEGDRPHVTVWLELPAERWTTAGIDIASWRLCWRNPEPDLLGSDGSSDVRSGALAGADALTLATRAAALGLRSLHQVAGDGPVLGLGADVVAVLDRETLTPLASLWMHDLGPVVVAEDGTFSMPHGAVQQALVTVGGVWVPARIVAPWLLDPLHLRSLAFDTARAPRALTVR